MVSLRIWQFPRLQLHDQRREFLSGRYHVKAPLSQLVEGQYLPCLLRTPWQFVSLWRQRSCNDLLPFENNRFYEDILVPSVQMAVVYYTEGITFPNQLPIAYSLNSFRICSILFVNASTRSSLLKCINDLLHVGHWKTRSTASSKGTFLHPGVLQ